MLTLGNIICYAGTELFYFILPMILSITAKSRRLLNYRKGFKNFIKCPGRPETAISVVHCVFPLINKKPYHSSSKSDSCQMCLFNIASFLFSLTWHENYFALSKAARHFDEATSTPGARDSVRLVAILGASNRPTQVIWSAAACASLTTSSWELPIS